MPSSRAALVRGAAVSVALVSLMVAAVAAPDAPAVDPVSRFLAERGLVTRQATPAATVDAMPGTTDSTKNALVSRIRDRASDMVLTAMNFLGVRYRYGGESADHGFDCSGFTRHVFEMSLGLVLPRRADEQARSGSLIAIKRDELKPGDLVFFNTLKRTFSHVGIYIGEGKFIHAPRPGSEVRVEDMRFAYWSKRFTGARRAESALEATAAAIPLEAVSTTGASAQAQ